MYKFIAIAIVTLISSSSFAKNKEVMGVIARCDCYESTVDGQNFLGKVNNETPQRTADQARNSAYNRCSKNMDNSLAASVSNCHYIKAVDEKVGKRIKRRIEKITGDEENNLHNDLISTL